jgi:hypothetical protein
VAHSCPSPIVRITDTILISNDFIIDNIHINFFRCDADPVVLAKHVLALLNKENPESELRGAMCDELEVFLQQETKGFVDQLFVTLETKSYLQGSPTSRSRSRSPNRDRDRTARRSRDHATINNRRNDRSRSPPRRPSSRPPVVAPGFDLPPVGAPAQALIVTPPWLRNVQCAHFRDHSRCPRGDLCYYVTGPYQPDEDLWESLDMPGRDPPQNPQQPPPGQLPAASARQPASCSYSRDGIP